MNEAIAKLAGTDRDDEAAAGSWRRSPTISWVSLCLAVALHVADEAANDFLSVYNPSVLRIRERLPFLPLPTFTFEAWIAGLAIAIVVALALSPFVFRQKTWMRVVVVIVSALMILNGLAHLAGSIRTGSVMPGTLSSPILLTAATWTFSQAWAGWNSR